MTTHTQLPIYKVAYDLLDVATSLVKNMQRDFKHEIAMQGTGDVSEDQALALAKLYAYRRQIEETLTEGELETYRRTRQRLW